MDMHAAVERSREGMELEFEARGDAEVRARPARAPEPLRLIVRGRSPDPTFGRHQFDRTQAVNGQPEPALQPSDPASERQARHARVSDDADRADESVLLRRDIE